MPRCFVVSLPVHNTYNWKKDYYVSCYSANRLNDLKVESSQHTSTKSWRNNLLAGNTRGPFAYVSDALFLNNVLIRDPQFPKNNNLDILQLFKGAEKNRHA